MYINEGKISIGKTVNVIKMVVWSILLIIFVTVFFCYLVENEKNFVEIFAFLVLSIIFGRLFFKTIKYYSLMDNMYFYERYFEGDLDGYMYTEDVANTIYLKEKIVNKELTKLLKRKYMKNFYLTNENGKVKITLTSKIEKCECKNCGGIIDKRVYFTGICPYCGSSDLFAKEIQGSFNKNNFTDNHIQGNAYLAKNVKSKKILDAILVFFLSIIAIIFIFIFFGFTSETGDISGAVLLLLISVINLFWSYMLGENLLYLAYACKYSEYFMRSTINQPFIDVPEFKDVRDYKNGMSSNADNFIFTTYEIYKTTPIKVLIRTLKKGYLVNCNMEVHNGKIQIALAKKVVKDTCPYCGAPIVGATEKDYICKYCGSVIPDVISKK